MITVDTQDPIPVGKLTDITTWSPQELDKISSIGLSGREVALLVGALNDSINVCLNPPFDTAEQLRDRWQLQARLLETKKPGRS